MNKPKPAKGVLGRVIKLLISCYPVLVPVVTVCIILTAAAPPYSLRKLSQ